jgi:hypothetical protein
VPTTMPSMLHLSRVPEDNEHAMQLHRVASGSSKLTGNAGDIPQLPVVQGPPPPPGPGTTSARRLAALHRAARDYLLTTYYLLVNLPNSRTTPSYLPPSQMGSQRIADAKGNGRPLRRARSPALLLQPPFLTVLDSRLATATGVRGQPLLGC